MGIALELLMARDDDIAALIRKPEQSRAFLKKSWSGDASNEAPETRRSMSIWNIHSEVDGVLRAGRPFGELPFGFLSAEEHVLGRVKRTHRKDDVTWNEYKDDGFGYGPPTALLAARVAEIDRALAAVDETWVRGAYNPEKLLSQVDRDRLAASEIDERIGACQAAVHELKAFLFRAARGQMGLILFLW